MAGATRIQSWCLFLAAYNYDRQFRSHGKHANCDGLSRLPCAEGQGKHANCDGLSCLQCAEGHGKHANGDGLSRLPCAEGSTSSESAD